MRHKVVVSLSLIVLVVCGRAHAAVIDSEDFESFSPVPFDISTDANWMVAAGQELNVNVVSSSLSYQRGAVRVDGGTQALEVGPGLPSATTNNLVDWTFTPTSNNDFWFSFLLQTSETASSSIAGTTDERNFFQIFFSEAGAEGQSLSMVLDNERGGPPDSDHNFRARAGSSNQNTNGFTDATGDVLNQPTETFFLVGRIEKVGDEYETVSIYANPGTAEAPATPTAMSTWEPLSSATIQQMTVRISGQESDDSYLIDQIIVGESYADVVPTVVFVEGDFDGNGTVNDADYDILANNLFEGTTFEQGDIDFSGLVDLNDFIRFREVFNAANPGGLAASIPEPSAIILAILMGAPLWLMGRRPSSSRASIALD